MNFRFVFAADISAYSDEVSIDAESLEDAVEKARNLWEKKTPVLKPAYDLPWNSQRIACVLVGDKVVSDGIELETSESGN